MLRDVYVLGKYRDVILPMTVIPPRQEAVPKSVTDVVLTDIFTDRVTAKSVGIAYAAIAESRLSPFRVRFPPLPEQTVIVEYLDKATASTEAAIDLDRYRIELLEEYRTRLIADVVTGKLDVRKIVATLPEEPEEQELTEEGSPPIDGDIEEGFAGLEESVR